MNAPMFEVGTKHITSVFTQILLIFELLTLFFASVSIIV